MKNGYGHPDGKLPKPSSKLLRPFTREWRCYDTANRLLIALPKGTDFAHMSPDSVHMSPDFAHMSPISELFNYPWDKPSGLYLATPAERWLSLLQSTGKPVPIATTGILITDILCSVYICMIRVSTMFTDIPRLITGAFVNGSTPITLLRGVTRIYLHHMNGMECCTSIAVQTVHMTSLKATS
ncbi:hypothetical protein PilKf_00212 [Pillotina sp. SPG140]